MHSFHTSGRHICCRPFCIVPHGRAGAFPAPSDGLHESVLAVTCDPSDRSGSQEPAGNTARMWAGSRPQPSTSNFCWQVGRRIRGGVLRRERAMDNRSCSRSTLSCSTAAPSRFAQSSIRASLMWHVRVI